LSGNTIAYKSLSNKLKTIDPERVFSIVYKDGNEKIVYEPDSLDPLEFKVDEMRDFIKGEQDARVFYKNNAIKAGGVVVGAGFALLTFYGLIGPPLYATVVGSYSPDVEKKLTFKVEGDAAQDFGITPGPYLNNVTGKSSSPVIKSNQVLKLAGKKIEFKNDTNLDSAVNLLNSNFDCTLVHASNDNGMLKLYKSDNPAKINVDAYREGFEKRSRDYKIRAAGLSALVGFTLGIITYGFVFNE
jgi:hypothetical protein